MSALSQQVEVCPARGCAVEGFVETLEAVVCEQVNARRWSEQKASAYKQAVVDAAKLSAPMRSLPYPAARSLCAFFMYYHPAAGMVSTPQIAERYRRDHSSICHGIDCVSEAVLYNQKRILAGCARRVNEIISEQYGAIDLGRIARGRFKKQEERMRLIASGRRRGCAI